MKAEAGMGTTYWITSFHPSAFRLHPSSWRSELESNQPIGFFRPALIHLSYPTWYWFLDFGLWSLSFE